jgi:hypothetical protein
LPKLADTNVATEELFGCLPNLKDILCRKLLPGEHVPGWDGPELLKGLSFYHAELNTNQIFYGDWRYDILHNRVTKWIDEYGEEYEEALRPSSSMTSWLPGTRAFRPTSSTRSSD